MRTTLDLPPGLVDEARAAIGFKSKTDTVVFALKEVVRRSRLDELKSLVRRIEYPPDGTSRVRLAVRADAALSDRRHDDSATIWRCLFLSPLVSARR
jgi:hypothetical protein